ncbi:YciI family protein [Ornithinimicrobium cryptoxanthini]|uniref:YciI family protein n=1 Tax=Ornithinimicrobium cryptoxanthini TaxID=2934161 RepID=A0ABY4YJD8_9MICO|nr:YciI family protein [Ornithinimicrobium cryptoxanthini]USQ76915.1 YciI family protein [Ornithinimicrobium cryptoxanthini]
MKFVVFLMSEGEMPPWDEQTEEQQSVAMQRHDDFGAACQAAAGVTILAGEALDGMPTTVRTRGGERSVTDGPYAEVVEQLGGFYLIEAPGLATLLELTTLLPAYDLQISPVGEEEAS